MNKKKEGYYKGLFLTAAVYDIVLGIIFTFFYKFGFSFLNISYPEYPGYISLIGVFVFVIGIAYFFIYRNIKINGNFNKDLIKVGVLYKLAYCAVAFYYWAFGNLPHIIFGVVFGIIDFIFLILFIECFNYIKKEFLD